MWPLQFSTLIVTLIEPFYRFNFIIEVGSIEIQLSIHFLVVMVPIERYDNFKNTGYYSI